MLKNIADALNAMAADNGFDATEACPDSAAWLHQESDGSFRVTDMAGFMVGTGLVSKRNKGVPGFDPMDKSAENDVFGLPEKDRVHFFRSVAKILADNSEEFSKLDGFDATAVEDYIAEALKSNEATIAEEQTRLFDRIKSICHSRKVGRYEQRDYILGFLTVWLTIGYGQSFGTLKWYAAGTKEEHAHILIIAEVLSHH